MRIARIAVRRRIAAVLAVGVTAAVAVNGATSFTAQASASSPTCTSAGTPIGSPYTVPAGVDRVYVTLAGQAGQDWIYQGPDWKAKGGLGSTLVFTVDVSAGDVLQVGKLSGAAGGTSSHPGGPLGIYNAIGADGGKGGDAEYLNSIAPGGCQTPVAVAAGGGGGGAAVARGGDGTGGYPANASFGGNADAGSGATDGIAARSNGAVDGGGGGRASATSGGSGGAYGHSLQACSNGNSGTGGSFESGGTGANGVSYGTSTVCSSGEGAGGGGAGYYYGGGGGSGFDVYPSGGGGGGSSYIDPTRVSVQSQAASDPGVWTAADSDNPSVAAGGGAIIADPTIEPLYNTVTTINSSLNPSNPGQAVTFTANVAAANPALPIGGGSVSFEDNNVDVATVPLTITDSTGTATYSSSTLSSGSHKVTAFYIGYDNGTYLDRSSTKSLTQAITTAQSITFTSTPGTRTAFGATYTPTASATSGLPVTFSIDSSTAGVCTIAGSVVSFVAKGTCLIDADQAGNGTYLAAARVQQSVTVLGGKDQAINFTSTPPTDFKVGSDPYTPTATGGASGQPVVFSVDRADPCVVYAGQVYAARGGTCVVHANQAGGNGYEAAAQVDQLVVVPPQPQQVVFSSTAPTHPAIGDTYVVKASTDSGQRAVLSLDPASKGCALTDLRQGLGYNIWQGTVTYTGAGTCVIDGDSPAIAGEYTAAPTTQQTSTVLGLPQAITFTSTDPASPTYGGSYDVSATGGGSNNPVTFTSATPATCTTSGATVSFIGAGACTIHADQTGDNVYAAAATVSKTLTVHPAAVTVTGPTKDYVYGAVPNTFTPSYDGLVNGDTAASLSVGATCTLATSNPDAGQHTITCSGASDPDYAFTYVTGTATVAAAPLTITASDGSFGYGGTPPAITATYTGLVNGDTDLATPPTCNTSASSSSAVGSYASTCHDAADPNYDISYVDGTVTVTHATLTITPADASTVYGSSVPTIKPSYAGLVNGDTAPATPPTCETSVTRTSAVGTYAATCSGAADPNYTIGYAPGTVTVTPAALDVDAPELSKTFGDAVPTLTPTYDGLVAGDEAPATGATCQTAATSSSPVGSYPITCSSASDPNYTISYVTGTLHVTRAALTITPNPASTVYGSAAPSITPTYDGLVAGDLAPTTTPMCTSAVTTHTATGQYASVCSGAADATYTIDYVAGTVTVTRAPLTVVAPDVQKTYGADSGDLVPSYLGFVAGDTAVATAAGCAADANSASDVGAYPIHCAGAADPNYDISYVAGTLTIVPAALTITASDATTTYGTVASISAAYDGLADGDDAPATAPTCGTTATATSDVGTYPSSCSGAADPNYTISYVSGTVTVTAAEQSIVTTFAAPSHPVVGSTLALTVATTASGAGVQYSRDPASDGICTVTAAGAVSFNGLGTCTVTLNRPASLDYAAAEQTVRLVVDTIGPSWRSGSTLPAGQVGIRYSHRVVDSATPAPRDELVSGTLPPGLKLVGDPLLTGIPTRAGTYTFVLAAVNRGGRATRTFTVTVSAAATSSPPSTSDGSSHSNAGSTTSGSATQVGGRSGGSGLATTGANLLALISLAVALLSVGMLLNRRRRYCLPSVR